MEEETCGYCGEGGHLHICNTCGDWYCERCCVADGRGGWECSDCAGEGVMKCFSKLRAESY